MFQLALALLLAATAGWLIQQISGGAIDRAISAFAELVGGWRSDAWPRGVQEEDRDRPWGRGTVAPVIQAIAEAPARAIATVHVRGRTRRR